MIVCAYCQSEYHDSKYRPGTCANCGAGKDVKEVTSPNRKEAMVRNMYGSLEVIDDDTGEFIRVPTTEDIEYYISKNGTAEVNVCYDDSKPLFPDELKEIKETVQADSRNYIQRLFSL